MPGHQKRSESVQMRTFLWTIIVAFMVYGTSSNAVAAMVSIINLSNEFGGETTQTVNSQANDAGGGVARFVSYFDGAAQLMKKELSYTGAHTVQTGEVKCIELYVEGKKVSSEIFYDDVSIAKTGVNKAYLYFDAHEKMCRQEDRYAEKHTLEVGVSKVTTRYDANGYKEKAVTEYSASFAGDTSIIRSVELYSRGGRVIERQNHYAPAFVARDGLQSTASMLDEAGRISQNIFNYTGNHAGNTVTRVSEHFSDGIITRVETLYASRYASESGIERGVEYYQNKLLVKTEAYYTQGYSHRNGVLKSVDYFDDRKVLVKREFHFTEQRAREQGTALLIEQHGSVAHATVGTP